MCFKARSGLRAAAARTIATAGCDPLSNLHAVAVPRGVAAEGISSTHRFTAIDIGTGWACMWEAAWTRSFVTTLRRWARSIRTTRTGFKRRRHTRHIPYDVAAERIRSTHGRAASQIVACCAFMRLTAGSRTDIATLFGTVASVRPQRQLDAELIPEEVATEVLSIQFDHRFTAGGVTALWRVIMHKTAIARGLITALHV